jgi:hypothetical protein
VGFVGGCVEEGRSGRMGGQEYVREYVLLRSVALTVVCKEM